MADKSTEAERLLSRVHVVLVEPQGPRNVGAAARAMANFGLSRLVMVNGPPPDHPEVRLMAVKASAILESCERVSTLDEAVREHTFLVGTTARSRDRQAVMSPREMAPLILAEAARGTVGILFGREDHGLPANALRRTHAVVAVEASPSFRALNLAQAVLLIAYELHQAARAPAGRVGSDPGRLLTSEMSTCLIQEMAAAMEILGIIHDGTRLAHTRSLERLFALGPMQTRDARVLFALARRIRSLEKELAPLKGKRNRDS